MTDPTPIQNQAQFPAPSWMLLLANGIGRDIPSLLQKKPPGDRRWSKAASRRSPSILALLVCLGCQAWSGDTASASSPSPVGHDSACAREGSGFFMSTPISLKETRSVAGIGLGWNAPTWMARLEIGFMEEDGAVDRPTALDLSAGGFWKHNRGGDVSLYEGIVVTDQTGLIRSFEGHAVSMLFLAGIEVRPGQGRWAYHLEAGTGGAFTQRMGSYQGGTVISAGLSHYVGD